jgi:acyl homoserine lactone synthase
MGCAPVPSAENVWELSRFAAVDFKCPRRDGQFSSATAIGLMHAAQRSAAASGVERFITVSPPGVERLLRRAGFRVGRAGPRMRLRGYALFACWIEMPEAADSFDGMAIRASRSTGPAAESESLFVPA